MIGDNGFMLFSYPSSRHTRTESPPHYRDYSAYKPFLRKEFEYHCVYCRMPDTYLQQVDYFSVDHYRPKSIYGTLTNVYSNLYYCCKKCNDRKKSVWRKNAREFVPNPCDHWMTQHLRYEAERVVTHSPAGKFTVELLQLNHLDRIKGRNCMLSHFELANREIDRLLKLRKAFRKMRFWFLIRGFRFRHLKKIQADLNRMRNIRRALLGIVL